MIANDVPIARADTIRSRGRTPGRHVGRRAIQVDARGMSLGQRVRAARRARGLSQTALAEAADVSLKSVQVLERGIGEPMAWTLGRVAAVLGVGLDDLWWGVRDG
jgi:DNA-binding XRE family transcriptional regulator